MTSRRPSRSSTAACPYRGRDLRPSAELLAGSGQLNLSTNLGPLDPLCVLHDGRGYEELLPHTTVLTDESSAIRVLDLETLIGVKAATGRARDKLVLPDTDGWNACHRFDGFQPRRKRAVDDRVGMHQGRRAPNIFCLSGAMLSARRSTVLKMDRPMWSSDTASSPIWRDRRTASKL